MDFALTRAEKVGFLRMLSVFDGRNVSSDLRRDVVKCDGLALCSPFGESSNETFKSFVLCFLFAQKLEQIRVGAGVLVHVSPHVDASIQYPSPVKTISSVPSLEISSRHT